MGTYENVRKTVVLRGHLWNTQGTHCFVFVKTNGKLKENTGVAWELIENARKTNVLRGD